MRSIFDNLTRINPGGFLKPTTSILASQDCHATKWIYSSFRLPCAVCWVLFFSMMGPSITCQGLLAFLVTVRFGTRAWTVLFKAPSPKILNPPIKMFSRFITCFLIAALAIFAAATTTVSALSFPLDYLLSDSNYLAFILNTHSCLNSCLTM